MTVRNISLVAILISLFSLQSCVTQYATTTNASSAISLETQYKSDANSLALQKRIEIEKQILISSLTNESNQTSHEAGAIYKTAGKELTSAMAYSADADGLLNEASTFLGTPYRYGGMSRSGIDCSAFVLSVYKNAKGINLPRTAAMQSGEGVSVDKSDLKKGDLLFFSQNGGRISHVAMVQEVTSDGEVKFIHSASSKGVSYSSLNNSYWKPKFRFARRILTPENLALAKTTITENRYITQ